MSTQKSASNSTEQSLYVFSACTDPAPAVLNDWCDNDAIRSRSGCRPSAHSRVVNVRDLTADRPNVRRRRRHPGVSSISRRTSGDDRPTSRDPDQIHLLSPMKPREQTTNRSITLPRTRLYAHDLYMCRKKTTEDAWLKKQDRSEGELQPYVPFRNNVHVRYTTHFCSRQCCQSAPTRMHQTSYYISQNFQECNTPDPRGSARGEDGGQERRKGAGEWREERGGEEKGEGKKGSGR